MAKIYGLLEESPANWIDPDQRRKTIELIKTAKFNAFMPCVMHGRGTNWPSVVDTKDASMFPSTSPTTEFGDLVTQCHNEGIAVYPWFLSSIRENPPLAHAEFAPAGTPSGRYNVFLPTFRTFVKDLINEVVTLYPVDGIYLDDFSGTGGSWTGALGTADYEAINGGRSRVNDEAEWNRHKFTNPYVNPFQSWLNSGPNALIKLISDTIRVTRPGVKIIGSFTPIVISKVFPDDGILDWYTWVNNGYFDRFELQDYTIPLPSVSDYVTMKSKVTDPTKISLTFGAYHNWGAGAFTPQFHNRNPREFGESFARANDQFDNGISVYFRPYFTTAMAKMVARSIS
jgi:uncharacterized lipoprotein YddW (UPF0748 family)